MSDRPGRYFHAWMLSKVWELLAEVRRNGHIPDGPITVYASDGQFTATFTITLNSPPESAERATTGTQVFAAPLPADSVLNSLSPMERSVFAVCTATPQNAKQIARRCQRSINRVREAISSLVAKELLERTYKWGIRLARRPG